MALDTIDDETASRLIHHSDRGCQYCSDAYVSELKKHGVSISMTQSGDPLENAIAERANGILKSEWLYKMTIQTREVCKLELCRIIDFYNTQRPHMSIGWQTPERAHNQCGEQQRCWKNYYRQAVASEDPQLGVYAPGLSKLTEETLTEEVAVQKKVVTFDARLVVAGRTAGNNQQKRKSLVFQRHVNGNSTFDNHFRGMDHPM